MPKSCFVSAFGLPTPVLNRLPSQARVLRVVALASFLALTLAACGGGGGNGLAGGASSPGGTTTPPPPPPPPQTPQVGNGTGTAYQDGIIKTSDATLDVGEKATLSVNVVVGSTYAGTYTITFTSPCATSGRASFDPVVNPSTGAFTVGYNNINCEGPDIVTATLSDGGDKATVTHTMIGPPVLSVAFVSSTFDQLSLAGIGGNESAELTFRVSGPQAIPVIGKQVTFSINTTAGGASILAGRQTGVTNTLGEVRTILVSGTVAGPVNVLATHSESGRQGLSADIIISTGVPVANRFSLTYTPFNPPGAFDTDGIQVTFSIIASDAFGNNPTDGTRISFVSPESGNIQNFCLLANGACSVIWRSSAPRPANMRATVIAYTDGAEHFVDNNGNSVFDAADGVISDLGEPFVDENESGAYNLGEYFFDSDRDGVRDIGNTLWDGPCLAKVNVAAVCTGNNTVTIYATKTIVMSTDTPRITSLGTFPTVGTTINIVQGQNLVFSGIVLADSNATADAQGGNPLPFGTTVTFAIDGGGATLIGLPASTVPLTTAPTGPYGITLRATPVVAPAPLPASVRLVLNVQVPGESLQQFVWPLNVTF